MITQPNDFLNGRMKFKEFSKYIKEQFDNIQIYPIIPIRDICKLLYYKTRGYRSNMYNIL